MLVDIVTNHNFLGITDIATALCCVELDLS